MAKAQTAFEALEQLARDLHIGMISGPLQPPDAGRLYLGNRSVTDIIMSMFGEQPVAMAIAAGGPADERVLSGTAKLQAEGVDRLERAIHDAGGHLYQGQLELLTPRDWLDRHGSASMHPELAPSSARYGWNDNLSNAETATLDTSPELAAARAAGWPAVFANEPVLFLGDEPLYYILMRENVGRNVTILIGTLA